MASTFQPLLTCPWLTATPLRLRFLVCSPAQRQSGLLRMRKGLLVLLLLCACGLAFVLLGNASVSGLVLKCVLSFQQKGSAGVVLYTALYTVATVLLFPGTPLTLGAGFLYGTVVGAMVVSVASTLAATGGFLLARYIARDWLLRHSKRYTPLRAFDRAIADEGFKMVLLMRLQPVFIPFAYLNMGLGLSRVRLRDFVLGSWLGMLPGTILYVYAGSLLNLAYFDHFSAHSLVVHVPHQLHRLVGIGGGAAFLMLSLLLSRIARASLHRIQENGADV
jgi:uncharacterized membrane protein YdjX (TVP38/TMEM64 family)